MGREQKPTTFSRRDNREKTLTFLGNGDNDVEKYGMKAYIFIHLERLEDYSRWGSDIPGSGLQHWLHQIYQRVWSSFTAAGNHISSAEFYELVPGNLWDDWVEGRPQIAIAERNQVDDIRGMEWFIETYIPCDEPIVIALASDDGTPEYYSALEKRKNVVTSHHIHYHRPISFKDDNDSDVCEAQSVESDAEDNGTIYTDPPAKWYYKSFRSEKPLPEKRKIVIEPKPRGTQAKKPRKVEAEV